MSCTFRATNPQSSMGRRSTHIHQLHTRPLGIMPPAWPSLFGVGMAVGAAWGGGGWCCNSGWGGHNEININNNNTFVNNSNRTNNVSNRQNNVSNRSGNRTGNSSWQHNGQHRGGTPYSNRATANQYGGTARGDSAGARQANARQNQGQLGSRGQGGQAGNVDSREPATVRSRTIEVPTAAIVPPGIAALVVAPIVPVEIAGLAAAEIVLATAAFPREAAQKAEPSGVGPVE